MAGAGSKSGSPAFIERIIRFSLENRLVILLIAVAIVAWGVMVAPFDWKLGALPRDPVPVDAIPDIGENQQIVFTEWMGRSPRDIEDQITYPLTSSLLGIPGVKTVRSYSYFGFSTIYVIFDDGVDFYWSRSRLLEKLSALPPGTLPAGVSPALGPDATALGQVFWYTLEGYDREGRPTGGWDLGELRSIQDWTVRYALMSARGVAGAPAGRRSSAGSFPVRSSLGVAAPLNCAICQAVRFEKMERVSSRLLARRRSISSLMLTSVSVPT